MVVRVRIGDSIVDYDADKDVEETRGIRGIRLADMIFSGAAELVDEEREYWISVVRVALPRFSEAIGGERVHVDEIKERLGEIKRAGYEVKPYSKMKKREARNYLRNIRMDIAREAGTYCPDILREVYAANAEQKRDLINNH